MPSLPQSLIDQLGNTEGQLPSLPFLSSRLWIHNHLESAYHGLPTRKQFVSRKEARKQDRLGRKRRKAEHFSSTPSTNPHGAKEFSPPKRKKIKASAQVQVKTIQPRKSAQKSPSLSVDLVKARPKGTSALEKLIEPHGIPAYRQKDRDEDAYEAYLEAKLGYGKVDKRKIYSEDGLDGISAFKFSNNISTVFCAQIYST
jgi:nucleolar MIF4G domain-containing protein 1